MARKPTEFTIPASVAATMAGVSPQAIGDAVRRRRLHSRKSRTNGARLLVLSEVLHYARTRTSRRPTMLDKLRSALTTSPALTAPAVEESHT